MLDHVSSPKNHYIHKANLIEKIGEIKLEYRLLSLMYCGWNELSQLSHPEIHNSLMELQSSDSRIILTYL